MTPSPDDGPLRVLVVCVGNRCRSPLAERLLQQRVDAVAPGRVRVGSAGTIGPDGHPMDADAAAELVRLGGDPAGFVSRRLTPDLAAGADLVLTATADLRQRVVALSPRALKRTFTLAELAAILAAGGLDDVAPRDLPRAAAARRPAGAAAADVPDPIGLGPEAHRDAAERIEAAVDVVAAALAR
jgi:protein-tyrosine phosphatase